MNGDSSKHIDFRVISERINNVMETKSRKSETTKEKSIIEELLKEPKKILESEERSINLVIIFQEWFLNLYQYQQYCQQSTFFKSFR